MNTEWFRPTKKQLFYLVSYYMTVLCIGIVGTIYCLLNENNPQFQIIQLALIGNISISLIGVTVFYARKIYKVLINIEESDTDADRNYKKLGGILYFYFRPIFSICFAVLIVIFIKAGVLLVSIDSNELDKKFIFFTMFISFFAGFSAGDFLDILESKGRKVIAKLINS